MAKIRIEIFVRHGFVHRPRRERHADEAKLVDRAPQFAHRLLHVLKRQNRQSFEPLRRALAVGVQPIVVRPRNRAGQVGIFDPAASAQRETGKRRRDIDALDIHVCQTRAGEGFASRGFRPGAAAAPAAGPPQSAPAPEVLPKAAAAETPAAFVCEDDVRVALKEGRQILVGEKTIITPAARDAGEAAVSAPRRLARASLDP